MEEGRHGEVVGRCGGHQLGWRRIELVGSRKVCEKKLDRLGSKFQLGFSLVVLSYGIYLLSLDLQVPHL